MVGQVVSGRQRENVGSSDSLVGPASFIYFLQVTHNDTESIIEWLATNAFT